MSAPEVQRRIDTPPLRKPRGPLRTTAEPEWTDLHRQIAATLLPGFAGTTLPKWLAKRLRDGLAGVCVFGGNIVSRRQLRTLTDLIRAANPNALVTIDEEGGDVTRLYYDRGSPYPGNAVLGRIDDVEHTESVAAIVGWELRLAGCNLDFAPDVDINSNPDNPVIGVRSFGSAPELVARHSAAWVRGLQSTGIAVSAKHLPGHGDTAQDSHLALPVIDLSLDWLRARELRPFMAAIDAGARTIMTSHILLPQVDPSAPATLSRPDRHSGSGGTRPRRGLRSMVYVGTDNTDNQLGEIEAAILAAVAEGRLAAERLADAEARMLGFVSSLAVDAANIPIPTYVTLDDEPEFDLARTVAAFDVRPGVRIEPDRVLGAFETAVNVTVGESPWGPAASGAAGAHIRSSASELPSGGQLMIVGEDHHWHDWVRELIDDARVRHPSTVIVDMGWPSDNGAYADIATFGASHHVGRALLAWLNAAEKTDAAA